MKTTTNHGLKKPDGTDLVNIEDLNYNADKLDGLLVPATTTANGLMSSADKTKLNGVATGANNYTHPATHAASMITGLSTVATSGSYNDLLNKPSTFPPSSHTHDDRYYTESEINTKLNGKSDTSHTHSDLTTLVDRGYLQTKTSSDVNKLTTNGKYKYGGSLNVPSYGTWLIDVTIEDGGRVAQLATCIFGVDDGKSFTRRSQNDLSSEWEAWREMATTTKLNINTANGFYSGWTEIYSDVLNVEIVGDIVHVRAILQVANSVQDVKINETALPTPAKDWWVSCNCLDDANNFNIYMGWDGFMYCKRPSFSGVFEIDFTYRKR